MYFPVLLCMLRLLLFIQNTIGNVFIGRSYTNSMQRNHNNNNNNNDDDSNKDNTDKNCKNNNSLQYVFICLLLEKENMGKDKEEDAQTNQWDKSKLIE